MGTEAKILELTGHTVIRVDSEDEPRIAERKWRLSVASNDRTTVYSSDRPFTTLAKYVLKIDRQCCVRHLNGDCLDFRKENLVPTGGLRSSLRTVDASSSDLVIAGNDVLISLSNSDRVAVVELHDFAVVSGRLWRETNGTTCKYCESDSGPLHSLIVPAPTGYVVDHRDGDGLNNRRSNLRVATPTQNLRNARKMRTINGGSTSSSFKGVYRISDRQFKVTITVDGSQVYGGRFKTELEAARRYDELARKYFGEFARVNFPTANEVGCLV